MTLYIAIPNPDENVLRKHVEFFDRIRMALCILGRLIEVLSGFGFVGLRAIGAAVVLSAFTAVLVNVGLSSSTRPGKGFSILRPIEVANILQFGRHGMYDTEAYDAKGSFVPSKEMFAKHARTYPDYLTSDELQELLKANREPKDYRGWVGARVEWKLLYLLGKDPSRVVRKVTVYMVYDGSLFAKLEK